jgi:hypothetical protein
MLDALIHYRAAFGRVRAELLADRLRYQGASPVVRPIDGSGYYAVTVGNGPATMYARHERAFVPVATVRGWIAEREHVSRVNNELLTFRSIAC